MTNAPHPEAARLAESGARVAGSSTASAASPSGFASLVHGTRTRSDEPSRLGRLFAVVAIVEAITWTGLLVGMFLKYVTETTELGVFVFGRLHGAAFVLYAIVTVAAAIRLRWGWKPALLAGLAAIPPLATLPLEVGLRRRGYLRRPAAGVDDGADHIPV
jgi:integral membrane protein